MRVVVLALLLALLLAEPAAAQPAFDAVTTVTTTATSGSFNHTPVGTPVYVIVSFGFDRTSTSVSSVSYGGAALSLLRREVDPSTINSVELWGRAAPAAGLQAIAWSLVGGAAFTGIAAQTYTDAAGSAGAGGTAGTSGLSTTPSVALLSAAGRLVIDTMHDRVRTATVGAGQTQRYNIAPGTQLWTGSDEAGAASVTMSWAMSGSSEWTIAAVELCSVACPAVGGGSRLLLGVGR